MARTRTALGLLALPGGLALTAALVDGGQRMLDGSTSAGADPAAAVAGLAAVLAALIAGWLTLCLALTLAAELPGAVGAAARELRDRVTPVVVRRWAAIVLGASVTATVVPGTAVAAVRASVDTPPAPTTPPVPTTAPTGGSATPSPGWSPASSPTSLPSPGFAPSSDRAPSGTVARTPSPGWVPQRPATRYRGDPHLLTGRHRTDADERSVAVRRGDTLWSIAAAHLGPEATDAEIARAWPRWHAANAETIGTDPDHLLPGTLLTPPATH